MPECICPNCNTPFSASSSAFGENYRCSTCGFEFKLDTKHLAHYQLPNVIHIQLQDINEQPFTRFSVPVLVSYGYEFPPLRSNPEGQILITKEMFLKAQRDEVSTGIMDHKGDYSLNRFIQIKIPGRSEAVALANSRLGSQWPILDFEKELYNNIDSLGAAYVPEEDVVPVETVVDLSKTNGVVTLELIVKTL